jgi:hypothetical protein
MRRHADNDDAPAPQAASGENTAPYSVDEQRAENR